MEASVRTRVVSWNDAAEMNESVESEAFVMPSSSGRPVAGRPPSLMTRSFSSANANLSTCSSRRNFVSPTSSTLRQRVFLLCAVIGLHVEFALAFRHLAELDRAIDLADDRSLMRLAGFEQLDHARQTSGDVFRLGGLAWNLSQHVARVNSIAVL